MGVWTRWRCWAVAAAVLSVILTPAAASLSPSGINYEGTLPPSPPPSVAKSPQQDSLKLVL
jgi:hypothetical protein